MVRSSAFAVLGAVAEDGPSLEQAVPVSRATAGWCSSRRDPHIPGAMPTEPCPRVMTQWLMALVGVCCLTVAHAAQAQPEEPATDSAVEGAPDAPPPVEEAEAAAPEAAEEGADASTSTADAAAASDEPVAEEPVVEDDVVVTEGGLFEEAGAGTETDTAASTEGGGGVAPTYELGGYVRGDIFVGKVPNQSDFQTKAAYGELAAKLRVTGGARGDAFAEMRLRYGQQGDETDLFADLREAYVNLYLGPLDLKLGQQIVVWGRADGFNPTNNITPLDLSVRSPIEDDRRVGNFGARAFLTFSPIRIEGVWMPLYRAVELPPVEMPSVVTFAEPLYPENRLENGLVAGRVHLLLPAFEMSVSALRGYSLYPSLTRVGLINEPPTILVARTAYQHQVYGVDFSTTLGQKIGLRGEAAYRRALRFEKGSHVPQPDLQYVLGVDRSFGPVSVIAQYLGRYVFDWEEHKQPSYGPFNITTWDVIDPGVVDQVTEIAEQEIAWRNQLLFWQSAEVQHMASLRVEWLTLHETLSVSALGLASLTTEDWLLYPKVSYQFTDQVSGAVGAEIYSGPEGALLDLIDQTMTAGYAELRVGF